MTGPYSAPTASQAAAGGAQPAEPSSRPQPPSLVADRGRADRAMTVVATVEPPAQQAATPVPGRLRIGIVAPPWVEVPPVAYGGAELMIDALARGLAARGHRVQLFTLGSSTCGVERGWLYESTPAQIGTAIVEIRHAMAAYDALADCTVVHDHTLAGVLLASLGLTAAPVLTTAHGPFDADLADLYRRVGHQVGVIAISADQASRAPAGLPLASVIHHGLDLDRYPPRLHGPSDGYLLCLSRMHPDKGIDAAIKIARRAGRQLIIAAKMREPAEQAYFTNTIQPLLDHSVTYVGEVDHPTKVQLLQGADALLNPIAWPEPFGLTMIEALACGTPVIATPNGAAPEIVTPTINGYLAATPDQFVTAIERLTDIDRRRCRRDATTRFSMQAMAAEHETLYRHTITRHHQRDGVPPTGGGPAELTRFR